MVWLAWRQHRLEGVIAAGLLGAVAVLLLLTGLESQHAFDSARLGGCLTDRTHHCSLAIAQFQERFSSFGTISGWLNLLPGLIGVLLAAPLVLELEQGTYRLAWTQSATRSRWLWTRLAVLAAAACIAGVAISVLFSWWRRPFDRIDGRMSPSVFDFQGIVPIAYILFAVALAIAIAATTRRAGLALAGAFTLYVAVRLGVQTWLREHYESALRLTWTPGAREPSGIEHAWKLAGGIVGRDGRRIEDPDSVIRSCGPNVKLAGPQSCFRRHGIFDSVVYQPASRFWDFQAIEFLLFCGLAAALVAVTVRSIRRLT